MAASEEGDQVAGLATADDALLKDAKAIGEHCRAAEAELKSLRGGQAAEARWLEVWEEEPKARETAVATVTLNWSKRPKIRPRSVAAWRS